MGPPMLGRRQCRQRDSLWREHENQGLRTGDLFGRYEFSAPYLLAQSDCESLSIRELLALEPGAQEDFLDTWLGYSENDGAPALRRRSPACTRSAVRKTCCCMWARRRPSSGALNVLVEPGEHVICQFPTYQSLYEVARATGCEFSLWPLHQGEDGWYCDLDELERLITPKTRLLVLNTPNNPTGYALSADERQRICELARRHGLRILADEVYQGPGSAGCRAPGLLRHLRTGLFRGRALQGLRPARPARGLDRLAGTGRHRRPEPLQELSQHLLPHAFRSPGPHRAEARPGRPGPQPEIIARNRRIAADFFARYDHVFLHNPPQAGPIAFHGLRPDFMARFGSALAFCEHLAQSAGVLLLPGNVYDMDEPYVRMGYGRANFAENLAVLDGWLQQNG